jgi:hypothetical protein
MTNSKALVVAALLPFVAGCHNWSPTEIPATAGPLAGNPPRVQVTITDGSRMIVVNPVIGADSLIGYTSLRRVGTVRLAIPTTRITALDVPKFNALGTAVLILGVGLAAFVLSVALLVSSLPS